jgi:hypothetical protein
MLQLSRPRLVIALAGLLALLSAVVVCAGSGASSARSESMAADSDHPISASELALRNEMRKLWEDHVTWTRMVIVSVAADLPDRQAAVGRLLANQDDLGDAIKPYYGDAAGERLAELLREHIVIAADVLAAAKAGDSDALNAALERWYDNGNEIAAFLNAANPRNWPLEAMRAMLREHLDLTTNEAVARLGGDWDADVRAYDRAHEQVLEMADMLSEGIVDQFPGRFRP